jgi:GMP synthase (glutamine-hydrolysing)
MSKRILLIQIRDPHDAMLSHEAKCVQRKLARLDVELDTLNALAHPIDPDAFKGIDGVIIGGSGDFSVHHPLSRAFVEPMFKTLDVLSGLALPTFGICFGHQLIGSWLGSTVHTDPERAELGTVRVAKTAVGEEFAMLKLFAQSFFVHCGHSDLVTECPSGCDVILSNESVQTQGFSVRGIPMASVQFHPDMTAMEARDRLLAYADGFRDRIETDAESFARKFELGKDESTELIDAFFRSHGFA